MQTVMKFVAVSIFLLQVVEKDITQMMNLIPHPVLHALKGNTKIQLEPVNALSVLY